MPKYSIEIKPQPDPNKTGEWYFTVKARNSKTVIPVEGHNNLQDLYELIINLKAEFANASVFITDKKGKRQPVTTFLLNKLNAKP